ncbi:ubiquitin-like domain-containing protein [Aeromicrobium sp. CF3.5]|uniref:ubiquitin-like domain-containing protein n=1 Tax=Aeromicrobium sp. CF3.5 TaxID=3373078 RepID=UPI003EE55925
MSLSRPKHKSLPLIALYVAIALVVAGGTTAYGAMSNSVTLSVDGKTEDIRTLGGSVGDVLESRDIEVRPDDRLSLAADHDLSDGDEIELDYAKPVTLSLDGKMSKHTVYENTVADAVDEIGIDLPAGSFVSEDDSAALSRESNSLVVSTNKDLVIKADGKKKKVKTAEPTVAGALEAADIKLGEDDEVKPGISSYLEPDQTIAVTRIETVTKTETVTVDFDTDVQEDAEALEGEVDVVTKGVAGETKREVELVLANGEVRDRKVLGTDVVSKPVTQVEKHGTKAPPAPEPAQAVSLDGVWGKLAQCESGGNPRANNAGLYFGLYQFSPQTWAAVGGSGSPADASPAEQTQRAKTLQAQSGWGQWPACAAKLGLL